MDRFAEDDWAEIGKRLALVVVFLLGCGCWMVVGLREWSRLEFPDTRLATQKTPIGP